MSKAHTNNVVEKLIDFILAPISLHHSIKIAPPVTQNCYKQNRYALPGLGFNPNAVKVQKTAQFQLSQFYHDKKRLVIWHDVVNNSMSLHRSISKMPLTPSELIIELENYQNRIAVIVYLPREGTPDITAQLKRRALSTIHIVKVIVSRSKEKDHCLLKYYRALHQKPALKLKSLIVVLKHENYLRFLVARSLPKKLSKLRQKTLRTRRAFNTLKPLTTLGGHGSTMLRRKPCGEG